MLRKSLLFATLAASVGLLAQSQPAYTSPSLPAGMNQPSSPTVVVAPSGPSIYIFAGGIYGTYLTPLGTLPFQSVGITLASREGVSFELPLQTGIVTALTNPIPGGLVYGITPTLAGMAPVIPGVWPASTWPGATAVAEGRLISDLGPSYYVSTTGEGRPVPSLGEVSAEYKKGHPRAVRIFTNADAERLAKP
jgi:hypothetical protein